MVRVSGSSLGHEDHSAVILGRLFYSHSACLHPDINGNRRTGEVHAGGSVSHPGIGNNTPNC